MKIRYMNRNAQRLYESIISNITRDFKKPINERRTFDRSTFLQISMHVYRQWLETCDDFVDEQMNNGTLYKGMDFYDAVEIIDRYLNAKLDQLAGGDWWEIGEKAGYTDEEVESIWVDKMQAKVDCICGIDEEDEDEYENDEDM